MNERSYEVNRRPARRHLTAIPEDVVAHFEGKDKSVTLASSDPHYVTMLGTKDRHPVLADDLPEDILRSLTSSGFSIEPDGTIKKPDCLLYEQPLAAREFWREEAENQRLLMEDPETIYQQMEENNQELQRRARAMGRPGAFSRLDPEHSQVGKPSDHVVPHSILREQMEEAERERSSNQ